MILRCLFGYSLRNKQTAFGNTTDNVDARLPSPRLRHTVREPLFCNISVLLTRFRWASDDVVYAMVSASFNPAITKEPPIRPVAVPVIDRHACAGVVS